MGRLIDQSNPESTSLLEQLTKYCTFPL